MKFSFIHLIKFRVDNARVFQRVSMNHWSSGIPTIVPSYSKHFGCVLCLLNRTDCYVWIRRKNWWFFVL